MSLKILLGKFVAFFAGQIPVEGHKNIIDSFQKLIVSPKRFICAHGEQLSQTKAARSIRKFCQRTRPLECLESLGAVESVSSLFEDAMNISDRLVGIPFA